MVGFHCRAFSHSSLAGLLDPNHENILLKRNQLAYIWLNLQVIVCKRQEVQPYQGMVPARNFSRFVKSAA